MQKERIAENIARMYDHLDGVENRKAIFAHYMQIDDSGLFPISGSFNATERAIRCVRKFEHGYDQQLFGLELCLALDEHVSEIVNSVL